MRHQLFSMGVGLALLLSAGAATAHAAVCQQSGDNQGNNTGCGPSVSATPELDSLALFGTGAAGMVAYGLMRLRAGRRQGKDTD